MYSGKFSFASKEGSKHLIEWADSVCGRGNISCRITDDLFMSDCLTWEEEAFPLTLDMKYSPACLKQKNGTLFKATMERKHGAKIGRCFEQRLF